MDPVYRYEVWIERERRNEERRVFIFGDGKMMVKAYASKDAPHPAGETYGELDLNSGADPFLFFMQASDSKEVRERLKQIVAEHKGKRRTG